MISETHSLKLTRAIKYRESVSKKSELLLHKLLAPICSGHEKYETINILVAGAGNFPSYYSLIKVLHNEMPFLHSVCFTLVEPAKEETDFFKNHFEKFSDNVLPKISVDICNQGLKDFLQSEKNKKFDLVYFEHPETMTLPILLAKLGISRFKRSISLREAIPYLGQILKPHAWIIASFMSNHELSQMESLLKFSFKIDSPLVKSSHLINYFYGGPYCAGLSCKIKQRIVSSDLLSKKIHKSDGYLFVVLLLSFIIYCIKFTKPYFLIEQLAAIFIMYAQLYFHRLGFKGILIKGSLLVGLFLI